MTDWQPIETAPDRGEPHFRGRWMHISEQPWQGDEWSWHCMAGYVYDDERDDAGPRFYLLDDCETDEKPDDWTHWLPLGELPAKPSKPLPEPPR